MLDDLRFFSRKRLRPSFSILVSGTVPVHRTISPGLFGPVHHIRLAAPFTSTVLLSRSPSEPYRDAFAASDADVNET